MCLIYFWLTYFLEIFWADLLLTYKYFQNLLNLNESVICLSEAPGSASIDREDTYPPAFDRVIVAHQGQSLSHSRLQMGVSSLPQTQKTLDYLLLKAAWKRKHVKHLHCKEKP